jgi:hypothetical protein
MLEEDLNSTQAHEKCSVSVIRVEIEFEFSLLTVSGAQNFGANFNIPGLVTIGPNFQILGQLSGEAELHMYVPL